MPDSHISPFQMVVSQITDFECVNLMVGSGNADELKHSLKGSFSLEYADHIWRGHITFMYEAVRKDEKTESFHLSVCSQHFFVYHAEETEKERARFEKLLKTNGAISSLAILRTSTSVAANTLGVRIPVLVPSVNLNEFEWQNTPN